MTEPPPRPREGGRTPSGKDRAALSRDLSEFLIELSIGVHRFAMYPPEHPSLAPAAENVIVRLAPLLESRRLLSIGVARDQLVIDGVATDPGHPVLSELARRLHAHQLGAVAFHRGAHIEEVEELLGRLAADPEREAEPLGLLPEKERPSWEGVRIFPVGYDQLDMGEEEDALEPSPSVELWVGLARAILASDDLSDPEEVPASDLLARRISEREKETAYDQVIVGYMLQLARELRSTRDEEADEVRARMSELIRSLDRPTLRRLVGMGGAAPSLGRQLLLDANQSLSVDAVMRILQAAAETSEQTISHSMTRLLSKMAAHSREGARKVRAEADSALRENVEQLMADWELQDPNPGTYTLVLDDIARSTPLLQPRGEAPVPDEAEAPGSGALRVLQTAVEVEAVGPTVEKAVQALVEEGQLALVFETLNEAGPQNQAAAQLRDELASSGRLSELLAQEDVDERVLAAMVDQIGAEAVDLMLEALAESESRAIRRKVLDRLARLEPGRFPVVEKTLEALSRETRWYVLRNLLGLLEEIGSLPESFSALPYLSHGDARVRRKAFLLVLDRPEERDEALHRAVSDPDERLVRMALTTAKGALPPRAVRVVVQRLLGDDEMPELRPLAVRALAESDAPAARDGLLEVSCTRSFLGRKKLVEKSQELLLALAGLARRWSHDEEVRRILDLALREEDPEVRAAAVGEGP